ncbi:ferredoxin [Gordonia sputi]|uniref:ferredoxin n=1 Tax=Gordonia sputi TaxID=36823 RepID=UPI0036C67D0C
MTLINRLTGVESPNTGSRLAVDRIACDARGLCALVLADHVRLDEWGYPIVDDDQVPADAGATAIRLCPSRALRWR